MTDCEQTGIRAPIEALIGAPGWVYAVGLLIGLALAGTALEIAVASGLLSD